MAKLMSIWLKKEINNRTLTSITIYIQTALTSFSLLSQSLIWNEQFQN